MVKLLRFFTLVLGDLVYHVQRYLMSHKDDVVFFGGMTLAFFSTIHFANVISKVILGEDTSDLTVLARVAVSLAVGTVFFALESRFILLLYWIWESDILLSIPVYIKRTWDKANDKRKR